LTRKSTPLICVILLVGASIATADTKSWTGAVNNLWSVGGNWSGGVAPVSGDVLLFPNGAANQSMSNDISGLSLQSVSFATTSPYTVSGNTLVLVGGLTTTQCCPPIGWNVPTILGASQTFTDVAITTFGSTIDLNGQTLTLVPYVTTLSGSMVGSGGFVLNAAGGLNLTGTSTFTGTFTVSPSARINVAGSISNSTLTIGSGGRLSGDGTVPATSLTGATLSVGNDSGVGCCPDPQTTGILSTGNLSIQGGTVLLDIRSTTPGTGHDQVKTTGTVTLTNPTLQVALPGVLPAPGQSFVIIDNDGTDPISGTFNGLPEGATFTAGGVPFRITYIGGTGNDTVITALTVTDHVVIPTLGAVTLALFALGLAAIGWLILNDLQLPK
jgi:fibronectin-binding autotransporter adhesin